MIKHKGVENEELQCPYDLSHRVIRKRFSTHLERCRKQHPLAKVVQCPFSNGHRVNVQELDWHTKNCPKRHNFELFKNVEAPIPGLSTTLHGGDTTQNNTFDTLNEIETSDNWDDMPDVESYNADSYVNKSPLLRHPVNMPPSGRAAFRDAERRRLATFDELKK